MRGICYTFPAGPMEIALIVVEGRNIGSDVTAIFPRGDLIVKDKTGACGVVPSLGIMQSATWRQRSIRITRL